MLEQEPGFCDWAFEMSQGEDPNGRLLKLAEWLKEQGFPRPVSQHAVGFGKYADLTYEEVLKQEPGFCDWVLAQSQGEEPGGRLLKLAEWLQEQGFPRAPANGDAPDGNSEPDSAVEDLFESLGSDSQAETSTDGSSSSNFKSDSEAEDLWASLGS